MNDEVKLQGPAQQQAAVMEQQAANQRTQEQAVSVQEQMTERQADVQSCARCVSENLDQESDRLNGSLQEAGASDAVTQAARELRDSSQDAVSSAADRANQFIAAALSDVAQANQNQNQQQQMLDTIDAVCNLAQNYAIAVDERTLTLCADIEQKLDRGAEQDELRSVIEDAQKDLAGMREGLDAEMERLTQGRDAARMQDEQSGQQVDIQRQQMLDESKEGGERAAPAADREAMNRVADEVAAEGREIRAADIREEARKIKLAEIQEQNESGIHEPDFDEFGKENGRDTAVDLAEGKIGLKEAQANIHHETAVQEAPEWGTKSENLEILSETAHAEGAHGNNFNEERMGQAADPKYDEHAGFQLDEEFGELSPGEDLDEMVETASVDQPHNAEDRRIEELDASQELASAEEEKAEEVRRNEERERQRMEEARDAELREIERKAAEKERQQREIERAAEERKKALLEAERAAAERAREQREREKAEELRKEELLREERRKDELRRQEQNQN